LYLHLEKNLSAILQSGQLHSLTESRIGLEKESLRVSASGSIAQTPHPLTLGSALTNPYITTDFSEALTEMITPPCNSVAETLDFLADIEKFVCLNIKDELMWASSMPCVVEGGDSIPVAEYGSSNLGMMKKIYRRGLGYRYGRTMQVIAGVHFNYSYGENFWCLLQTLAANKDSPQNFKSATSMAQVRNILRYGWLVPYLFGASPAVCKSFLHGKPTILSSFSNGTAFEEYATSLRMGNIGYTNNKESMAGIKANYDSLETYVASLECAISTPYSEYQQIGVKIEGEYRQLSANILQIENEYYSTVRPKQIPQHGEMPIRALREHGIEYVELRSLDINPFEPMGISAEQMYFLEVFMLFCMLHDSAVLDADEIDAIDMNLIEVAHRGRAPNTELNRGNETIALKKWALSLCDAMADVAVLLDSAHGGQHYSASLKLQRDSVLDSSLTPSARVLQEMRDTGEEYFHFARRKAQEHQVFFNARALSAEREKLFKQLASESIAQQKQLEASDELMFDEFLKRYFASK
jgi:glutamate--cysteine ligase